MQRIVLDEYKPEEITISDLKSSFVGFKLNNCDCFMITRMQSDNGVNFEPGFIAVNLTNLESRYYFCAVSLRKYIELVHLKYPSFKFYSFDNIEELVNFSLRR